jgi:hypothetical protein
LESKPGFVIINGLRSPNKRTHLLIEEQKYSYGGEMAEEVSNDAKFLGKPFLQSTPNAPGPAHYEGCLFARAFRYA